MIHRIPTTTSIRGSDYLQGYNAINQVLQLTPDSGIWEINRTYVITLNNRDRYMLTAPDGAAIQDGDQFLIRDQAGNAVTFEYESGYKIWIPQTLTIQAVDAGRIADGDTFTITATVPDLTTLDPTDFVTLTGVFEFDKNGTFNPTNTIIRYQDDDTADDIGLAIFQALDADRTLGLAPQYLGDRVHIGSRGIHTLDVTTDSQLTQSGYAAGVLDGDVLRIDYTVAGATQSVAFEYDADGALTDPTSGNLLIPFDYGQTNEQIADSTVAAIRAAVPQLSRTVALGDGFVHLREATDSNLESYVVDASASRVWQTGLPGVEGVLQIRLPDDVFQIQVPPGGSSDITDDETFLIDDGNAAFTFEFDLDRSGPTSSRYVPILPTGTEDQDELARLIQDAIRTVFPTLTITYLGGGLIEFTSPPGGSMDTSGTANLTGTVRSGIADGETFQIRLAGTPTTFEFDNDANFTAGNIQVGFSPIANGDAVASAMVTAIQGAGLGLVPVYLGGGVVQLNESPQYAFDPLTSTLSVTGVPGGAVAIEYIPSESFTAENMAGVIISAINRTGFSSFGATAKLRGGKTIFLDGALLDPANPDPAQAVQAITPAAIRAAFVAGIRDDAGNFLKANQPDGETRFTIILGAASFDFGDLADDPDVTDDFRTRVESNGAQHVQLKDVSLRQAPGWTRKSTASRPPPRTATTWAATSICRTPCRCRWPCCHCRPCRLPMPGTSWISARSRSAMAFVT